MSKPKINYVVDVLILFAFLAVSLTGILLLLVSGGRGTSHYFILGVPRAGWIELHDWAGVSMMIGVFLHFVLHWKWVVCMTGNMLRVIAPKAADVECPVILEANR